jgi:radical SAM superfamily enzyme YgiQ (UPF0313 family)
MDVILVRIPKGSPQTGDLAPSEKYYLDYYEDLAVSYLSACLTASDYKCKVIDTEWKRLDEKELSQICLQEKCDVFAFSLHSYDFLKLALRTILEIKKVRPNVNIILGGHPLTDIDMEIMENFKFIDFVLRGEGEKSIIELVNAIYGNKEYKEILGLTYRSCGNVMRNDDAPRMTDLDSIPEPNRYIWEDADLPKPYYALVYASRGCYGRCNMCSVRAFYGKQGHHWIGRSAESIVNEITNLNRKYGVKIFSIIDPDFMGCGKVGRKRAVDFANLIMSKDLDIKFDIACRVNDVDFGTFKILKEAGLYKVFLGIESGNQKVLDQLVKDTTVEQNIEAANIINELGILIETGFIMIMPDTTLDDISKNLKLIRRIKSFQPYRLGSRLFTHPNFEISKKLEEENIVYGNLLEKRYSLKDEGVNKYYDTWQLMYNVVTPVLGKISLILIHSLWNSDILTFIEKFNEEILSFFIDLLEDSIFRIKSGTYDKEYVNKLIEQFRIYMSEKEEKLLEFYESIGNELTQYEWIERKVSL